jgi:hypothetical protein
VISLSPPLPSSCLSVSMISSEPPRFNVCDVCERRACLEGTLPRELRGGKPRPSYLKASRGAVQPVLLVGWSGQRWSHADVPFNLGSPHLQSLADGRRMRKPRPTGTDLEVKQNLCGFYSGKCPARRGQNSTARARARQAVKARARAGRRNWALPAAGGRARARRRGALGLSPFLSSAA